MITKYLIFQRMLNSERDENGDFNGREGKKSEGFVGGGGGGEKLKVRKMNQSSTNKKGMQQGTGWK